MKRMMLTLALVVTAATSDVADADGQRAGVVTVTTGSVTVAHPPAAASPLKFRDDVFIHDRITTGERSLARILLGGKATVTISERSILTVTETPGRSTIDVVNGRISLAVARERMAPGDTVEIRTPTAIAGVRGTVVIAEVTPGAGVSSSRARFTVLKGLVEVVAIDAASGQTRPGSTMLGVRQALVAGPQGLSAAVTISAEAAERLGNAFKTAPRPGPSAHGVTSAQFRVAEEHASELLARDARNDGRGHGGDAAAADGDASTDEPQGDTARTDVPKLRLPKVQFPKLDALESPAPKLDVPKGDVLSGSAAADARRRGGRR
ncbi:MAG: FecR domain-containing protein [Candidatus Rokubacteria bacterium]|nr:FecR domain-containing protein [Candidatus Rokubacteria bacterium]